MQKYSRAVERKGEGKDLCIALAKKVRVMAKEVCASGKLILCAISGDGVVHTSTTSSLEKSDCTIVA